MKFFIDENIPYQIAKALSILEKKVEVHSIIDFFHSGISDEEWIPKLKEFSGVIITRDINIRKTRDQWQLFQENELIAFFIHPPSKNGFSYWQFVKIIINNWEEIINLSEKSERPACFKITSKGKIEKMD